MQHSLILFIPLFFFQFSFAQEREIINSTAHFLIINPDGRTNAMGEISTVSSSEYPGMGLFGNPALLNQGEMAYGLQLSYMPWLRQTIPGVSVFDAGAYYSISDRITVAYNYHQFYISDLLISYNNLILDNRVKEHAHNMRFGFAISERFSVGGGGKYFRSSHISKNIQHLFPEFSEMESYAFDAGFLFNSRLCFFNTKMNWQVGAHLENLGPKAAYGNHTSWPIPSKINMGVLLNFTELSELMPNMELDVAYQTQRLLVPNNQNELTAYHSIMQGLGDMFNSDLSFRFVHQVGVELRNNFAENFHVALRAGHYNQHYRSGDSKHLTYGLGLSYKMVHLDFFHANSLHRSVTYNKKGVSLGAKFNLGAGD